MNKLLNMLIVSLGFIVLAVLVVATLVSGISICGFTDFSNIGQGAALLPSIAISSGVLIAILAFARDRKKLEIERERQVSEVMLEHASHGFRNVITLLSDKNNDRIIWIRAARSLLKSVELRNNIKNEEYLMAYDLEVEKTRNELYSILSIVDENNVRKPLPPQFFYGIKNWHDNMSLDEAAIQSSIKIKVYSLSIDQIPPQANISQLSTNSVVAIYDFMEFPANYNDPLKSVEVWGEDWDKSLLIDQGARRYVAHTRQKYAVDGKLVEIKPSSSTNK